MNVPLGLAENLRPLRGAHLASKHEWCCSFMICLVGVGSCLAQLVNDTFMPILWMRWHGNNGMEWQQWQHVNGVVCLMVMHLTTNPYIRSN